MAKPAGISEKAWSYRVDGVPSPLQIILGHPQRFDLGRDMMPIANSIKLIPHLDEFTDVSPGRDDELWHSSFLAN